MIYAKVLASTISSHSAIVVVSLEYPKGLVYAIILNVVCRVLFALSFFSLLKHVLVGVPSPRGVDAPVRELPLG